MKKLGILLVTLITVTLVFSAIGCGGGGEGGGGATATPTHTVAATNTPSATGTPAGTEASGTLSEILGKALNIKSAYAEVVATEPGQSPVTQKIWVKMSETSYKMRMEATVTDASEAGEIGGETVAVGETVVYLYDFGTGASYIYYPAHNKALDMSMPLETPGPGATPTPTLGPSQESPWDMSSWLESYNPTIVGSEKYDGKDCLVVQYTEGGENTTMWIWKQYGIEIKTETTGPQGTSTIEYKNISFSDIPDSKFQLPAGVQTISMWESMGGWQ